MTTYDHLTDENEEYYPEVIIVFLFLMLIGCVVGLAIGSACAMVITW